MDDEVSRIITLCGSRIITLFGFSERASEQRAADVFGSHVEYTARQDRAEKVWGNAERNTSRRVSCVKMKPIDRLPTRLHCSSRACAIRRSLFHRIRIGMPYWN